MKRRWLLRNKCLCDFFSNSCSVFLYHDIWSHFNTITIQQGTLDIKYIWRQLNSCDPIAGRTITSVRTTELCRTCNIFLITSTCLPVTSLVWIYIRFFFKYIYVYSCEARAIQVSFYLIIGFSLQYLYLKFSALNSQRMHVCQKFLMILILSRGT